MDKKKVLIVSHAMELGGVERSLIGLLEAFDYNNYVVDLFLLRHEGELLKYIPDNVNLLPKIAAYTVLSRPMSQTMREGHVLLTMARIYGKIKAACFNKKHRYGESAVALEYSHKYTYRFMPPIQPNKEYDLAISFLTPHYIVTNKVCAKKKIAWIHTDYASIMIDVASEEKMWSAYDNIISISNSVTASFLEVFPNLKGKILLIENILPRQLIKKQANEFEVTKEFTHENINLLSIGRYCYPKNFDNIPKICKYILRAGINVKWYLIGYGPDEQLIKKEISINGMQGQVIVLGKKENPYPYIKECDVYIQPSRYEGKSVTVREAQMLHKPVIITNYLTAESQLENGVDGVIVPLDNAACANGIISVLNDKVLIEKLKINCSKRDYSNFEEIKKLYSLFY